MLKINVPFRSSFTRTFSSETMTVAGTDKG